MAAIFLIFTGRFLMNFHKNREANKVLMELQEQAQYAMERMINGVARGDYRTEGLMWAKKVTIDNQKRITFTDYTGDEFILETSTTQKLVIYPRDQGAPNDDNVIIPYIEGKQEYGRGDFTVSVKFEPAGQDNRSVSIDLTIQKDKMEFNLKSSVTPRNIDD